MPILHWRLLLFIMSSIYLKDNVSGRWNGRKGIEEKKKKKKPRKKNEKNKIPWVIRERE